MSKRKANNLVSLIVLSAILVNTFGLKYTLDLYFQMFKLFNSILLQLANASVLTIMFKYCIAFPIVGIILTAIGSPRGKEGHIIGKILYFIVGYIIGFILDYIATIIF